MITFLIITLVVLLIAASLMAWRYYSAAKYWRNAYHDRCNVDYSPSLLSTVETVARIAVMLAVAGSWIAVVRSKFGKNETK